MNWFQLSWHTKVSFNTVNVTSWFVNLSMHVVLHLIVFTIVFEHTTCYHDLQHVPNVFQVSWKVAVTVWWVLQLHPHAADSTNSFLAAFLLITEPWLLLLLTIPKCLLSSTRLMFFVCDEGEACLSLVCEVRALVRRREMRRTEKVCLLVNIVLRLLIEVFVWFLFVLVDWLV